ncbi:tetratricopeptide repeat protein [Clostridium sp.]|uniref:tetratricopeptide repeat protein n=1 Tax=Clostridium sp. TaxID=1506 RepID=UPI0028426B15|nr:tetratricopeptide repeat protein [Clostridium sp.]MDR3595712.1 tetratricopeptide repeat protein [Clostridium sp.]
MVDFDLEIKKAHPINIKEIELNRYRIDDKIKKSIILYNTAIGEIKKGNFDLVINDLKKALSYNKGFTEAIKLMGLCYVNMKEYKKAEKIFKKLDKYAMYNELVNEYMQSLLIKTFMSKNINTIEYANHISGRKKEQSVAVKGSKGKIIISLLFFMIVIAGTSLNYFYPKTVQGILAKFSISIKGVQEKFQANNKIADSEEKTDKNSVKDDISSEENTAANKEYENTQKSLEDTKLEADNYKNDTVNMLNDAEKFFNDGNYEKAASILISMKSRNFDDETKMRFDKLWQNLKPNPLWTIYNEGNKLYKEKNYSEALPKLVIASEIDPNLDIMPWITFQIGMCYKETNDNTNALTYFNKVKDDYPKSQYASNAKMMISQIGN